MSRSTARRLAALLLALTATGPVLAQEWARNMFETKDHDFGMVARGSDTVFKFPVKNLYKEDVVIESVRSSCGCTSATLESPIIKSLQTGYVVATFNTRAFTGLHSATLTVQITRPFPAQVQVRVHGNIRGDIVFEPGSVDFGTTDQGSPQEKTVSVSYAGRSGWSVSDVRSSNEHLEADLVERERNGGRVVYDLVVRLLDSAPAGLMKSQLVLVTNDGANPRIPVEISADVRPELSVAPSNLVLGDVPQGETVTKRLLVRGKRPFRITEVVCDDDRFTFETSDAPNDKQFVTLHFASKGEARRLRAPITIRTDLGETFVATCDVFATVTPSPSTAAQPGASVEGALESRTAQAR